MTFRGIGPSEVTDFDPWLPVRRCSNAIAARVIWCAIDVLDSAMAFSLVVGSATPHLGQ
jgi:hypothetical protein